MRVVRSIAPFARWTSLAAFVSIVVVGSTMVPCAAAGKPAEASTATGIAYDTVELASTTSATPRGEGFATDFQAAMVPHASCMPSVMRRYITPARERIDDICRQDATIVDCASRTVTTLDLRQRRFARYALDDVYDDGLASIAADSNGSQVTSTTHVERGAHGTTILDGTRVQEYTFVQTQATTSSSMSIVTRDSWTYDFSSSPLPTLTCLDVGAPWLSRYGWPWRYAPELQRFFADRQEKLASLTGSRFQISVNGAPLPDWRIPRYALGEHAQTQSGAPSFTYHFLLESGNVRTIRDDDPVFTVPKDFTAMRL